MIARTKELIVDTRGSFVEYIILIGLIALVGIAGYEAFGEDVRDTIDAQGESVRGIRTTPARAGE